MTFAAGDPAVALILTLTMNPALDTATTTDTVVPTEKLRCSEPRYDPGGGGINVARAVHLLGGEAMAIFPPGGMSGAMLCDLLKGEGVPHTFVPTAGLLRFARNERNVMSRISESRHWEVPGFGYTWGKPRLPLPRRKH